MHGPGVNALHCTWKVYGFVEFYAGLGNCSRCHKLAGIPTASLDLIYHEAPMRRENYMDILTSAGMGPLGMHGC